MLSPVAQCFDTSQCAAAAAVQSPRSAGPLPAAVLVAVHPGLAVYVQCRQHKCSGLSSVQKPQGCAARQPLLLLLLLSMVMVMMLLMNHPLLLPSLLKAPHQSLLTDET